jgi:hypothetical protein
MQTGHSVVCLWYAPLLTLRGFSSRVTEKRENDEYEGEEERVINITLKSRERLRT